MKYPDWVSAASGSIRLLDCARPQPGRLVNKNVIRIRAGARLRFTTTARHRPGKPGRLRATPGRRRASPSACKEAKGRVATSRPSAPGPHAERAEPTARARQKFGKSFERGYPPSRERKNPICGLFEAPRVGLEPATFRLTVVCCSVRQRNIRLPPSAQVLSGQLRVGQAGKSSGKSLRLARGALGHARNGFPRRCYALTSSRATLSSQHNRTDLAFKFPRDMHAEAAFEIVARVDVRADRVGD